MQIWACPPQYIHEVANLLEQMVGTKLTRVDEMLPYTYVVKGSAGDELYSDAERHPYVYLILKGITQMSASKGDADVIISFAGPQETLGGGGLQIIFKDPHAHVLPQVNRANDELRSYLMGEKPSHSAKAITDYLAVRADAKQLAKMAEEELSWSRLICTINTIAQGRHFQKLRRQMTLSPEARYKLMLQEEPAVVAAVQQRHLAQYLGVTPEGLSRISSRLRKRDSQPEDGQV